MEKYGLVLAGGGAKGAFQIALMKRLNSGRALRLTGESISLRSLKTPKNFSALKISLHFSKKLSKTAELMLRRRVTFYANISMKKR